MARWKCSHCGQEFEGGLFNLRNCPHCASPVREVLGLFFNAIKIVAMVVPLIIILKVFNKSLYDQTMNTLQNLVTFQSAVYYSPAFYFNNLVFMRKDSYYSVNQDLAAYHRMFGPDEKGRKAPALMVNAGQIVKVRGIFVRPDSVWLAAEWYRDESKLRYLVRMPRDWENYLWKIDEDSLDQRAKEDFRNAVLSQYPYREVLGKEAIRKFAEENPDYFRVDVVDNSVFKPVLKFFSQDYEAGYFIPRNYKAQADELRKSYLDENKFEKKLLQAR